MKVLALVADCAGCPRRVYYSGGRYECAEAGAGLPYDQNGHKGFIPEWCPLGEYPAAAMTRLADENAALRRQLAEARSVPAA